MTQQYAKFISETQVEYAPLNYKLEDGTVIFNFNINPDLMLQYNFKPLTKVERPTTRRFFKITYIETESTVNEVLTYLETKEEYEARIAKEERDRIDHLSLTKREVFLAIYKDKQITPDMIRSMLTTEEAKIEFDYANDYFRGNPLIAQLGEQLGYTPEQLDTLFETGVIPTEENN